MYMYLYLIIYLSFVFLTGNNIMFTIRTTRTFHEKRLPVIFDTWLKRVNGSNFFMVTDGEDIEYENKAKEYGEILILLTNVYNLSFIIRNALCYSILW